jgi:hypothetical protein
MAHRSNTGQCIASVIGNDKSSTRPPRHSVSARPPLSEGGALSETQIRGSVSAWRVAAPERRAVMAEGGGGGAGGGVRQRRGRQHHAGRWISAGGGGAAPLLRLGFVGGGGGNDLGRLLRL